MDFNLRGKFDAASNRFLEAKGDDSFDVSNVPLYLLGQEIAQSILSRLITNIGFEVQEDNISTSDYENFEVKNAKLNGTIFSFKYDILDQSCTQIYLSTGKSLANTDSLDELFSAVSLAGIEN